MRKIISVFLLGISTVFFASNMSAEPLAYPVGKLTFYFEPSADGQSAKAYLDNSTAAHMFAQLISSRANNDDTIKLGDFFTKDPEGQPIYIAPGTREVIRSSIAADKSYLFKIRIGEKVVHDCVLYKSSIYGWSTKGWVASCQAANS